MSMNKFRDEDKDLEIKPVSKKEKIYKKEMRAQKKKEEKEVNIVKGKVTNLLNFREGPGYNFSNIISYPVLHEGEQVTILETQNKEEKWYKIQALNSIIGYVNAAYVQII